MTSTLLLTFFTLVAFAANSIFCRMALTTSSIGPLEFTIIRLFSGMIALSPLLVFGGRVKPVGVLTLSWKSVAPAQFLFGYALFFSLAYVQLEAGIGALILFASVQMTMLGVSLFLGNRVSRIEWLGVAIALGGLVYLLLPGWSAPPLGGTLMMIASGASWGLYSLLGKREEQPIRSTARNFLFCLPGCVLLLTFTLAGRGEFVSSTDGILLAVLSGALASGCGYVLWYLTLKRLTTTVASIAQLASPILVGIGGLLFLHESLTLRLTVSTALIIGGIIVTILGRKSTN